MIEKFYRGVRGDLTNLAAELYNFGKEVKETINFLREERYVQQLGKDLNNFFDSRIWQAYMYLSNTGMLLLMNLTNPRDPLTYTVDAGAGFALTFRVVSDFHRYISNRNNIPHNQQISI